jgi:hypothetical protein
VGGVTRRPLVIVLGVALAGGALLGCVQPTHDRTVVYDVTVPDSLHATTVGLRGSGSPLSWERDTALTRTGDSTWRIVVTHRTGFLGVEVKLTADGRFELENGPNRRIPFAVDGDTTRVRLRYGMRE